MIMIKLNNKHKKRKKTTQMYGCEESLNPSPLRLFGYTSPTATVYEANYWKSWDTSITYL